MSKRAAYGPHTRREEGLDYRMSTPDEKPQRATAAQLANRRIKQLNQRRRPPTSGAPPQNGPFATIDPNIVPNSSAAAPAVSTNGFGFGSQSQSFPGTSSAPTSSLFGTGASSGFNFSASFDSSNISNPFAGVNGGATNQNQSSTPNFGGFGDNSFTSNQPQSNSQRVFQFGTKPSQATGSPLLFGNQDSGTSSSNPPTFQTNPPAASNMFAQATSQSTSSPFPPTSQFASASFQPPPEPVSNKFQSTSQPTSNLFPIASQFTSNHFQPNADPASTSSQPAAQTPSNPFAPAGSQNSKPFGQSLFSSAAPKNQSIFAVSKDSDLDTMQISPDSKPRNRPQNRFLTEPSESKKSFSFPSSTAPSPFSSGPTNQPLFLSQPAITTSNTPVLHPTPTAPQPAPLSNASTLFENNTPITQPSQGVPFGSLFMPATASPAPASPAPASPSASVPSFAFPKTSSAEMADKEPSNLISKKLEKPEQKTQRKLEKLETEMEERQKELRMQEKDLTQRQKELAEKDKRLAKKQSDLAQLQKKLLEQQESITSQPTSKVTTLSSSPLGSLGSGHVSKASWAGLSPKDLPDNMSDEEKANLTLLYQIRMLNEAFKRRIAKLDPATQNFDVLIQFYIKARKAIETPAKSLTNGVSGKRKASDMDASVMDPGEDSTKRTKANSSVIDTPFAALATLSSLSAAAPSVSSFEPAKTLFTDALAKTPKSLDPSGSSTANIFASSFSTTSTSNDIPATEQPAKPNVFSGFKPSAPSSGTSNSFFAQFKAQADKDAEKEKNKRKAEEFDSDEDDEEEWERRDSEAQHQKRQALEAQASKRVKFVAGKGFVFEDGSADSSSERAKSNSSAPSIFQTGVTKTPATSNLFGHLSATNSEAEEEPDGASSGGEDNGDLSRDATNVPPPGEGISATDKNPQKPMTTPANRIPDEGSSDEGDLTKALRKKSEAAAAAKKATNSDVASGVTTPTSRSLFERIEYGQDGKPKRQPDAEEKSIKDFLGSSKFASSFNTSSGPTSTPNGPANRPSSTLDNATPSSRSSSIFSSSINSTTAIFGSPAPPSFGASSGSLFGSSQNSPQGAGAGNDHTWKPNSPIKFSKDTPSSATSASKPETASNGLFGNLSKTQGMPQANIGFTFGGPSLQPGSSLFPPSTASSLGGSRASTPGVASDTGAEDSGEGESAEQLPQVDLTRGGAGEENEEVIFEARARGLKRSSAGWDSQGIGLVRILKHRATSKARILLRAQPSGNIVLNAALMQQVNYSLNNNSVMFLVPRPNGVPPEQWAIRVKKEEAEKLVMVMEEAKS